MFDFSTVGKTDAWLTRRRMSRPEAGFATIPTVEELLNDGLLLPPETTGCSGARCRTDDEPSI
jgi:hypothetical protein